MIDWVMISARRRRGRPSTTLGHPEQFEDEEGRLRYACRNCGMAYVHMPNLRRHRKKCEGHYHLQCHLCQQRFYRRDLYQDHLIMKHGTVDAMKGKLANSRIKR